MEKQLLDWITPADRAALSEVRWSLNEAHRAWNRIESGKQCDLNTLRHEESSLAYCLWWGLQAAEELTELRLFELSKEEGKASAE